MLSAINANHSQVRFGNTSLKQGHNNVRFGQAKVQDDLAKLDAQFMDVVQRAKKDKVSENNMVPAWKPLLQSIARNPQSNKSLADYVIESHPEEVKFLRDEYAKSTLLLEQEELKKPAGNDYKQLNSSFADLEARSSGMNPNSHALFVGSGPQPNTVLSYEQYAGKVTGIDIDPTAIKATEGIARDSKGKIEFKQANAYEFDYGPYSHIGVAVMIPEKGKVLQQIRKTGAPGCTVILRGVDGLKQAMYEGFNPDDLKGFDKVTTVHGTDKNITHAIILKKKPLDLVG